MQVWLETIKNTGDKIFNYMKLEDAYRIVFFFFFFIMEGPLSFQLSEFLTHSAKINK